MTRNAFPLRRLGRPGTSLSRRDALKGAALGTAALAGGVFSIGAARADTITMRVGSDSPIDAPHTLSAVRLKERVEKLTEGRIKVDIFPNSQLGDTAAMTTSVKSGTMDGVLSDLGNFAVSVPAAEVFVLPFLFKDMTQELNAANGELGAALKPRIEAAFNCEVLGWTSDGARNLWNRKRAVIKPEDMQGLKMRMSTGSKVLRDTYQAFGAIPTPLAFSETYTGLETGVIDGSDMGVIDMLQFKVYQVAKFLTLTSQSSPIAAFIVSKRFMSRLSPDDQKIVRDSVQLGTAEQVKVVAERQASALEELKAKGVGVFEMADRAAFVAKVQPILNDATTRVGADIMQMARAAAAS